MIHSFQEEYFRPEVNSFWSIFQELEVMKFWKQRTHRKPSYIPDVKDIELENKHHDHSDEEEMLPPTHERHPTPSIFHRKEYREELIARHKYFTRLVEDTRQAASDTRGLIEELSDSYYGVAKNALCNCCRATELKAIIEEVIGAYQRRIGKRIKVEFASSSAEDMAALHTCSTSRLLEHARRFSNLQHDVATIAKQEEYYTHLTNEDLSDDLEYLQKQYEQMKNQIEEDQRQIELLARAYHRAKQANVFVRYNRFRDIILDTLRYYYSLS